MEEKKNPMSELEKQFYLQFEKDGGRRIAEDSAEGNLDSEGTQEIENDFGAGEWGGYIDEFSNAGYGR